jgi:hypothetical protein
MLKLSMDAYGVEDAVLLEALLQERGPFCGEAQLLGCGGCALVLDAGVGAGR